MLWVVILALSFAVLAVLIEPFLRDRKITAALDEEDYLAAQVADIARDRAAGLISIEEAETAEKEARRRLLAVHRAAEKRVTKPAAKSVQYATIALAALAPLVAFIVYGALGNPSEEQTQAGQEIAARTSAQERAQMAAEMSPQERAAMVQGMVNNLAARLDQNPDDLEGWTMLGRSYGVLGEFDHAADAYGRAIELSPSDPNLHMGRVQALMSALEVAGSPIDQEAEEAIKALAALNQDHPFALYFQGLAAKQRGDTEGARGYWSRLVVLMPEDAPERARIEDMLNALQVAPSAMQKQ